MKITRPALIYQGGKFRLADWIISHFPPHVKYLEPFGGAASVLMQKGRAHTECYNDIDQRVVTVFRVMQDRKKAKELEYRLRYTPYSRDEWKLAYAEQTPEDDIETARRTIIRAFMSNGANGAVRKGASGFGIKFESSNRVASCDVWPDYPSWIEHFCARLRGVIIENKDALTLMKYFDGPDTLFYVDPPYMNGTWYSASGYKETLDDDYHIHLIEFLANAEGMAVLSGYDNPIYADLLKDWRHDKKETINQHNKPRTEHLWISPKAQARLEAVYPLLMGG